MKLIVQDLSNNNSKTNTQGLSDKIIPHSRGTRTV